MLYQEVNTYAHQDSATSLEAHKDDLSVNARSPFPNTISDGNSLTEDASCFMIDREENKERKNAICVPRLKWTEERLDALVSWLYDYKGQKDFDGKDIESDLIQMSEDIRKMMARKFSGDDFGPEAITTIPSEISERKIALLQ